MLAIVARHTSSYAESMGFLARAMALRQEIGDKRLAARVLFERAIHACARFLNCGFMLMPAHSPTWAMPYKSRHYIIVTGETEKHWYDALRALGEMLWYTLSGDRDSRRASEHGSAFALCLSLGVTR